MFRIDSIPHTTAIDTSTNHTPKPALHACLRTALSSHADNSSSGGILLTAGRKNCDITFETDKCVSRKHCQLRLVVHPNVRSQEEEEESNKTLALFAPQNEEEEEASKIAECGTILVLDDLGSKFGTFLLIPDEDKDDADKKKKNDGDDGSDTNDETDDEDAQQKASSISQPPHPHPPTNNNIPTNNQQQSMKMKQHKIPSKQSLILHSLSQMSSSKGGGGGNATIQCGVSGSTILITRIPLLFCCSRVPPQIKRTIHNLSYQIGARLVDHWDVNDGVSKENDDPSLSSSSCCSPTHLVTPSKVATAKVFSAWACHKPIVTPEFVLHLLHNRTNMTEELPDENAYIPPGETPCDLVDPTLDRKILRECIMISLANDEITHLAKAGGASHVICTHDYNDEEFYSKGWVEEWKARTVLEHKVLVFIDPSSKARKIKKRRLFLIQDMALDCTNGREIASSISGLTPLKDVNGVELKVLIQDDQEDQRSEQAHPEEEPKDKNGVVVAETEEELAMDTQQHHNDDDDAKPQAASQALWLSSQSKHKIQISNETDNIRSAKRPRRSLVLSQISKSEHQPQAQQQSQQQQKQQQKQRQNEPHTSKKRKRLPKTKDGWMVAAPIKRQAYRSLPVQNPHDGHHDDDDNTMFIPAQTEICNNLIIVRRPTAETNNTSSRRRRRQNNETGGPNFKKFKKNRIISGKYSCTLQPIKLVTVLPKESERQRQLEYTQQEIERKEMEADMLFADGRGGGGTKKKGGGGGGSSRRSKAASSSQGMSQGGGLMTSYFQQSETKKKRGVGGSRRRG